MCHFIHRQIHINSFRWVSFRVSSPSLSLNSIQFSSFISFLLGLSVVREPSAKAHHTIKSLVYIRLRARRIRFRNLIYIQKKIRIYTILVLHCFWSAHIVSEIEKECATEWRSKWMCVCVFVSPFHSFSFSVPNFFVVRETLLHSHSYVGKFKGNRGCCVDNLNCVRYYCYCYYYYNSYLVPIFILHHHHHHHSGLVLVNGKMYSTFEHTHTTHIIWKKDTSNSHNISSFRFYFLLLCCTRRAIP